MISVLDLYFQGHAGYKQAQIAAKIHSTYKATEGI